MNLQLFQKLDREGGRQEGRDARKARGKEGGRRVRNMGLSVLLPRVSIALGMKSGTFSAAGSMPGNTGILWGRLMGVLSALGVFSSSSDSSFLGDFSSVAKRRVLKLLAASILRFCFSLKLFHGSPSTDQV